MDRAREKRIGAAAATLEKAAGQLTTIVSEAMELPGTGKKKISEKPENNKLFTDSNSQVDRKNRRDAGLSSPPCVRRRYSECADISKCSHGY
jgi:hypothetical protein